MARLRRLTLSAQGLLEAQPYGRGLMGALKAVKALVNERLAQRTWEKMQVSTGDEFIGPIEEYVFINGRGYHYL